MGSVVLEDVGASTEVWGLAWVGFAAVVGFVLAAAAATFFQRRRTHADGEYECGYNALAATVDRYS